MHREGTRTWGIFALAGMVIAYFSVFLGYIGLGFLQLRARPFQDLRTAIILFRLQVGAASVAGRAGRALCTSLDELPCLYLAICLVAC